MERVRLPGTDLEVSRVCLGTWQFSGTSDKKDVTWGAVEEAQAEATIHAALKAGINFFDTAEAYGGHQAERVLGRALASSGVGRGGVVVASKFGVHVGADIKPYTAADMRQALSGTLEALQTDYVDLYQVHWHGNMRAAAELATALAEERQAGRIRHYSVCNFGARDLEEWMAVGGSATVNQVAYNLLWRAVEAEIVPKCQEHSMGLLCYSPLQQGLLSGKFTKAEQVPEGRRRTRHFAASSTNLSRHGEKGAEEATFAAIAALRDIAGALVDASLEGQARENALQQTMVGISKAWLLSQPAVSCVIVGARTPEQANAAAQVPSVPEEVLRRCTEATEQLKEELGPNADMWAEVSRIH